MNDSPLRPRRSHASVFLGVPGVPFWGAILLGTIGAVVGAVIGITVESGGRGIDIELGFTLCFLAGVVLAVFAVRRRALFTAMVQPPIIMTVVVIATFLARGGSLSKLGVFKLGSEFASSFPSMAVATGIAVLLGVVRIIAQPLRRRPQPQPYDEYVGSDY